jgi:hypothetical protein
MFMITYARCLLLISTAKIEACPYMCFHASSLRVFFADDDRGGKLSLNIYTYRYIWLVAEGHKRVHDRYTPTQDDDYIN